MFSVPELHRAKFSPPHPMHSTPADGNNGVFVIPHKGSRLYCIASDGAGWEHVSVTAWAGNHAAQMRKSRIPKWLEMCRIKDLFWTPGDTVLQYHPPQSEYVNCHPSCLHLWRPIGVEVPVPHHLLVGPKT